jgi:cytochrome c-type biogenesis protein CcmE
MKGLVVMGVVQKYCQESDLRLEMTDQIGWIGVRGPDELGTEGT